MFCYKSLAFKYKPVTLLKIYININNQSEYLLIRTNKDKMNKSISNDFGNIKFKNVREKWNILIDVENSKYWLPLVIIFKTFFFFNVKKHVF